MYYPSIFSDGFVDSLFDEAFGFPYAYGQKKAGKKKAERSMSTDVKEFDDKYELSLELPGYAKEEIKAELNKGYLTIVAEHNENKDEKDENGKYIRRERYYGKQQRSFFVGEDVKQEDINASFANGILKLDIPKVVAKPEVPEKKYIQIAG
jgi:HSP20 family molecular chaperone IbpA